jgi:hypothetical protein
MLFVGTVGQQQFSDGTPQSVRLGRQADLDVSELHGRFYEQTFRGNIFSTGMSITSINNATFTTGTLGATCTPILGVWNPSSSGVNLSILQASLSCALTALTATGGAPFVWATSVGNTAVSSGNAPFSRKTLQGAGSQAKAFNCSPALTGLTNNLAVQFGSIIAVGQPYNISEVATAAGFMTSASSDIESFDGSFIVPPGGVAALLATTTPVAHSVAGYLLWEENPA